MLNTAVSRATTADRYADAVGLTLPASRYEDPPLSAVVGAATRAMEHVRRLLARRSDAWPMPEFAILTRRGQSGNVSEQQEVEFAFVPGAARPAGGEIAGSPLLTPESANVEAIDQRAGLRGFVEAFGGLPLDWAARRSSWSPRSAEHSVTVADVLQAATMPPVPPELAEAFSSNVLAGKEGSRPLGPEGAWTRVEQLDTYLGKGLMAEELRYRLAEALAGGVMMRGSPPPWRTLVRDAAARRVAQAWERGGGERPLVVHFVAAFGQERLERNGDLVVLYLLEAEDFRVVSVVVGVGRLMHI